MAFGDLIKTARDPRSSFVTTYTPDLLSNPATGNLLIFGAASGRVSNTVGTAPSGFTEIQQATGSSSTWVWYYKVSVGTEQTASIIWNISDNGTATYLEYVWDGTTPTVTSNEDVTNISGTANSQASGAATPSTTSNICIATHGTGGNQLSFTGQAVDGSWIEDTIFANEGGGRAEFKFSSLVNAAVSSQNATHSDTDTGVDMYGSIAVFSSTTTLTATGSSQSQSASMSGTGTNPTGRVQQAITGAVTTQGSVFENFAGTPPDGSIVIYPSEDNTAVGATGIWTSDSGSTVTMWYQEVVDVSAFQTFTAINGAIGALQAQAATISGAAVLEHTASGSMQSQVALVSGSAGNVSGELVAQSSVMSGSAAIDKASSGALQAQSSSLLGTGIATSGFIAIGTLTAQSSVLSGVAEREVKASGSLQAQLALMSGQGNGSAIGIGSIAAQSSSMTGSGGKLWLPQVTVNTTWIETTTADTAWVSNG